MRMRVHLCRERACAADGKPGRRRGAARWAMFLLLAILTQIPAAPTLAAPDSVPAVRDAKEGVVCVMAGDGREFVFGTGFGVGKKGKKTQIFITSNSVIMDPDTGKPHKKIYIPLEDGAVTLTQFCQWVDRDRGRYVVTGEEVTEMQPDQIVECSVLYYSGGNPDFAILQAERDVDRVALPLLPSEDVEDASAVYTIGFLRNVTDYSTRVEREVGDGIHFIYEYQPFASAASASVFNGNLSRTTRDMLHGEGTDVYQHTAHNNDGGYGGPLLTADGAVIGVNTQGFGGTYDNEHGLSVMIDYALDKMDELGIGYDIAEKVAERKLADTLKSPAFIAVVVLCVGGISAAVIVAVRSARRKLKTAARISSQEGRQRQSSRELDVTVYDDWQRHDGGAQQFQMREDGSPVPAAQPWEDIAQAQVSLPWEIDLGTQPARQPEPAPRDRQREVESNVQRHVSARALRLQSVSGAFGNRRFAIGSVLRLGRNPACNDMVFPKDTKEISGAHCVLRWQDDDTLTVEDLHSSYGTFCNGTKLEPGVEVPLHAGDRLELGRAGERFEIMRSARA